VKITVFCKPNAKIPKVEKVDETTYRVAVKAAPEDGEANESVRKALADYFEVSISRVLILSGQKSRQKSVAIKER
jgi:uncharacterized protein (TIGR00251 family)